MVGSPQFAPNLRPRPCRQPRVGLAVPASCAERGGRGRDVRFPHSRRLLPARPLDHARAADATRVHAFAEALRRKLGDDAKRPACILTDRGVGCRMAGPGREIARRMPSHLTTSSKTHRRAM